NAARLGDVDALLRLEDRGALLLELVVLGVARLARRDHERHPDARERGEERADKYARPQPKLPAMYWRVRSARGEPNTWSAGPYSTRSPRYMNATWSATRWACWRLWVTISMATSERRWTISSSIRAVD